MRRRPFFLVLSALLFLYFPANFLWQIRNPDFGWDFADFILSIVLPIVALVGVIRVTLVGWYTLVVSIALWGIRDLHDYYSSAGLTNGQLMIHLGIYAISLAYFINPRIRHLYFDPKLRWWRAKPRYETHLPAIAKYGDQFHYPVLRNISEGGCFLETPHPPPSGSPIRVSIPLPVPLDVTVIQADGDVRWVSRNPLRSGIGVQFKDITAEQVKSVRKLLAAGL